LNPVAETGLLVSRELRRSVRSVKGIILGVITLVGAAVASLFVVWMQGADLARAGSEAALDEVNRKLVEKMTGDSALASQIASMPESLRTFLDITVWLAPLLIALLGFDGIAGELQHKAVRFWTVRARRTSYFAGKLLGLWALVAIVILALDVMVGVVTLLKGYVTLGELLKWEGRFWLVAVVIAGAWAAIATLISSFTRQPIAALLSTFGVFFLLWLASKVGEVLRGIELAKQMRQAMETNPDTIPTPVPLPMHWYEYLYPNGYEHMLLSSEPTKVMTAAGVLLGVVVVAILGGGFLFSRRDV